MEKISEVLILGTGQTVKLEGEKGTTFTPSVDANGNLSWTNDGGKQNPTTVNIKGERGEKGDTTVIDPSTATTYTLYNQTGNHTDGAMTQDAVTKEFEKLDEVYARNDGYYESMGVGTATNLKGQNVVDAEFAYRKSGGNVEVQDGNAMIEAIKGNTLAWNQALTGTTTTLITFTDGVYTINGTLKREWNEKQFVAIGDTVIGHVYIIHIKVIGGSCSNPNAKIYNGYEGTTSIKQGTRIFTSNGTSTRSLGIQGQVGDTFDNLKLTINSIDLTLIYGSGNEPATPEQFEQDYFNWFGKPLTYEPYDAGSLRNTKVSALKTVGFNLWDEEWEVGLYNVITGEKGTGTTRMRCKNYIPVIPNAVYYQSNNASQLMTALFYDANKNYLGTYVDTWESGGVITIPINVYFIRFYMTTGYGTTYNHDICINLSDPNRNGEYEPYKESTLPLDVTTLTGKLNGEGSSVVVFADGMNSAGDVHDEIKIENGVVKAIKRIGKLDLGSPTWNIDNQGTFYAAIEGISSATTGEIDYINAKYVYDRVPVSGTLASIQDKHIRRVGSYIGIKDNSYANTSDFKTAMNGVELYYELAEPEVYMLDDFNLPKLYPVANGGTEEQLSNSPNSLPATLSIRYGLNAAAFIQNAPKNYISKESMSNFLSNLGSAMGGTWTMTWNSSTNKYDFTFTQNRSVDVKQPIEDK